MRIVRSKRYKIFTNVQFQKHIKVSRLYKSAYFIQLYNCNVRKRNGYPVSGKNNLIRSAKLTNHTLTFTINALNLPKNTVFTAWQEWIQSKSYIKRSAGITEQNSCNTYLGKCFCILGSIVLSWKFWLKTEIVKIRYIS